MISYCVTNNVSLQISILKFISIFNVGGLGTVMIFSLILVKGPKRIELVGWICAVINLAVFAAPLSIMVRLTQSWHSGHIITTHLLSKRTKFRLSQYDPFMQRRVIRTKSVEYMPFMLSFSLTLCATAWFFYGYFVKDFYIAVSTNILVAIHVCDHDLSASWSGFIGTKCSWIFIWDCSNDTLLCIQGFK